MFKHFNQLTFTYRIFLSIMLFILLALVVMVLVIYYQFKTASYEYTQERLKNKEQMVLESVDYILSEHNEDSIQIEKEIGNDIFKISDIANVSNIGIYNLNGELLLSSNAEDTISKAHIPQYIERQLDPAKGRIQIDSINEKTSVKYITSFCYLYNNKNQPIGIINIPYYHDDDFFIKKMNNIFKTIGLVFLAIMIGSGLIAWIISKGITKKINTIANRLQKTDFHFQYEPIIYKNDDEITPLVNSYNAMLLKLNQQTSELAKIEREDAWREMAKQVAHEVKNPLTPMLLTVQNFQRNFDIKDPALDTKINNLINSLIIQIETISAIASAFSDFAKMPIKHDEEFDIIKEIKETIELFNYDAIHFTSTETSLLVAMDKVYLNRIITNLIKNARQSIPDYREKQINIMVKEVHKNIIITVEDNGIGIPTSLSHKIFEPKFSTKNDGTGLGLPMIKKIVEDYGGKITFESTPNMGSLFIIQLPVFVG